MVTRSATIRSQNDFMSDLVSGVDVDCGRGVPWTKLLIYHRSGELRNRDGPAAATPREAKGPPGRTADGAPRYLRSRGLLAFRGRGRLGLDVGGRARHRVAAPR